LQEETPLTESMQMYLISVARLREGQAPVALARLAETLGISPVSANEMCHKLQDGGWLVYRPYKGVTLTPEGERRALYVMRRHRLWEVFLVQHLGLDVALAHDTACQLEHVTSDLLADRLDGFLGYPQVNATGERIPKADGTLPQGTHSLLASLSPGQGGRVVRCDIDSGLVGLLSTCGLYPGARVSIMATMKDSLLVRAGETGISLARPLAESIEVEMEVEKRASG
jgi:DtxR family Mn-dependent transcriptional regulator